MAEIMMINTPLSVLAETPVNKSTDFPSLRATILHLWDCDMVNI